MHFRNTNIFRKPVKIEKIFLTQNTLVTTKHYSADDKKNRLQTFTFHFSENQFFSNDKLVIKVKHNEMDIVELEGTEINWKEGKDVTQYEKVKKQKNKKSGKTREVKEIVKMKSFFNLFKNWSPELDDNDDLEENTVYS